MTLQSIDELNNFHEDAYLSTGDDILDDYFCGGIRRGHLFQLVGRKSSGKTQFCMQLCAKLRSNNDFSNCVYITRFKKSFYTDRFLDMARKRGADASDEELLSNIYISSYTNSDTLITLLEECLTWDNLTLLCIENLDLITPIDAGNQGFQRKLYLKKLAALLHEVSNKFNAVVICINNTTFKKEKDNSLKEIPTFGVHWSQYFAYRLWFNISDHMDNVNDSFNRSRNIELCKWYERKYSLPLSFSIDESGLVGIKNDSYVHDGDYE